MDFDKELEALKKRVLHSTESDVLDQNNELNIPTNTTEQLSDIQEKEVILYQTENGNVNVSVFYYDETFWLTQKSLADLFGVDVSTINYHLKEIYAAKELNESSTIGIFPIVQIEGSRKVKRNVSFYNLDAIISVGYRINTMQATKFRQWATSTLKEYMIKGFVLNDDMLKNGKAFGRDYFDELLERIKEIRASERRFYQKITDIYAQCSYDYDSSSPITRSFFQTVQNKLLFAISGHTAPELINSRADSSKEHMGLTTWKNSPNGKILKSDVTVSKNYLNQKELSSLNDIVNMYLDYAENQAKRYKLMSMQDWIKKLDAFLNFNEYDILNNAGIVSREIVNQLALKEYELFRVKQDVEYTSDFDKLAERYL